MASEGVDPSVAFLLNCGKEFDVVVLAHSTEKALQIITPWCQMTNSSGPVVCREMRSQALVYAKAIDFSVDAANQGFAVCEDALTLVEYIQSTTAEERREFLEGVREITKKGLASAKEARDRFVHVRQTVEGLLVKMKAEDQEAKMEMEYRSGFHSFRRPFSEVQGQLTKGIHDLEEFSNILTKFVAWWNELAMETNTQLARQDGMAKLKADKFHLQAVERKWKDHRSRYAAYVNEINLVQDRYPKLFAESKHLPSVEEQHPERVASPPPSYGYNVPRSTSPEPWDYSPNSRNGAPMRPEQPLHEAHGDRRIPNVFVGHRPAQIAPINSVIISEHLSATSYMSASLASVQVLENNLCFIMLKFQCHPSQHRRFNSLRIKWRLKTIRGVHPAKMVDIAPKQAIGARNEENHTRTLAVKVPIQFKMGAVSGGPEVDGTWEMKKTLGHAMFITGSLRGHGPDAAEWTIDENSSAMTGIPPHFCVAALVQFEGLLMMELDVLAKQRGVSSWWSSRNQAKEDFSLDPYEASTRFPQHKPSGEWRTWFPQFNGEVVGGKVNHEQEPVARN